MANLRLQDLIAFLLFFLGPKRRPALDAIPAAQDYVANTLDPTLADIQALPPEHFGGEANAEQLAETDVVHDGFGLALMYLALAYLSLPTASAGAKTAARLILDYYVPNKRHLRAAYATEVTRAHASEARMDADKPVLDALPVEGGTSHLWVRGFVDAGLLLGDLLSGRSDAQGGRGPAGKLRLQAISEIVTLRQMLAKMWARLPDGGAKNDHYFFGYLDTLADLRDSGSKAAPPPPPAEDPAPAS